MRADELVGPDAEPPAGGDLRILLAHRPGSGVPRVRVQGLPLLLEPLVEVGEGAARHEDLAAYLEPIARWDLVQAQGDGAHRPQVGGHVFARRAIAARRPAEEAAPFVEEADRQAVDLQLADIGDGRIVRAASQAATHARVELTQVVGAEGVAEAEHGDVMPDRW